MRLGLDWLNNLTPSLNGNSEGYTTLSALLETIGIEKDTQRMSSWGRLQTAIKGAVAAIVADGMAHSGYFENGGGASTLDDVRTGIFKPTIRTDTNITELLAGTLQVPAPNIVNASSQSTTTFRRSLQMAGLAYSASGTGYFLALTVVFVHVLLALFHTAYSLWLRKTSGAWESFCDTFTLALSSKTSELPETWSGITAPECLEKGLLVREVNPSANAIRPNRNKLEVVVNGVPGVISGLPKAKVDTMYSA